MSFSLKFRNLCSRVIYLSSPWPALIWISHGKPLCRNIQMRRFNFSYFPPFLVEVSITPIPSYIVQCCQVLYSWRTPLTCQVLVDLKLVTRASYFWVFMNVWYLSLLLGAIRTNKWCLILSSYLIFWASPIQYFDFSINSTVRFITNFNDLVFLKCSMVVFLMKYIYY